MNVDNLLEKIIGCVRVNKPFKHLNNSYECAAWWEETEAKVGIYPVTLDRAYLYPKYLHGSCMIEAVVTDDYFPALWGGVAVSNKPYKPKHVGDVRSIHNKYSLHKLIMDTGTSPYSEFSKTDFDYYIDPVYWPIALQEAEHEMKAEYNWLQNNWEGRARPDSKFRSRLSAIRFSAEKVSVRAKEIEDIQRKMEYLKEEGDMWRNLHRDNTQWAREFLDNLKGQVQ